MKNLNIFVKTNLFKFYVGVLLLFWMLILASCEKEPTEPFEQPFAIDPTEIKGTWDITTFYMLEEGYKIDLGAWVVFVDDSAFNIGTLEFNGAADFDLIYGTRAEGYTSTMR